MTTQHAKYSEFFDLPKGWTKAKWGDKHEGGDRDLINEVDPFKWSGKGEPPKIGARVKCHLNGLGMGTVLKYFAEHGWLGVLVQLDKNPKWRKDQLDGNPPAHLFGLDLEKRAPIVPKPKPAPAAPVPTPAKIKTDLFD